MHEVKIILSEEEHAKLVRIAQANFRSIENTLRWLLSREADPAKQIKTVEDLLREYDLPPSLPAQPIVVEPVPEQPGRFQILMYGGAPEPNGPSWTGTPAPSDMMITTTSGDSEK